MEVPTLDDILARLRTVLEQDDLVSAVSIIEALCPPDQAEVFAELEDEDQRVLLPELDPTDSADILERLDEAEAADLAAELSTETLVRVVNEMEPDEAADLLGDMDPQQAQTVLSRLEDEEEIRPSMLHPDHTAGGLMTSEFLALHEKMTAIDAIKAIRDWKPETESVYYLFVVNGGNRLRGVINMRQLIIADPQVLVADIMDTEVIVARAEADQEECARLMSRYDLLALPILDANQMLLGVITIDDVIDVLVEEATEDIQRLGGAQPLKHSYLDTSVTEVMRKRVSWLMLLFITESLTGTVLRMFESELDAVVALASLP